MKKKRVRAQMTAKKKNPCHEKSQFDWLSVADVRGLVSPTATAGAAAAEGEQRAKRDRPDEQQRRLAGYFHGLLALPDALRVLDEHVSAAKKQKTAG